MEDSLLVEKPNFEGQQKHKPWTLCEVSIGWQLPPAFMLQHAEIQQKHHDVAENCPEHTYPPSDILLSLGPGTSRGLCGAEPQRSPRGEREAGDAGDGAGDGAGDSARGGRRRGESCEGRE
ncbi:unnamed protein product [Symbiodinium natans]|uniref:Uncharacterized protein n=1 Tax=Symbiodinium natans TaxID=878477 RepID=A0A812I4A0_9DINO|nr:unnamed protein product [Symbiodinium natans]